MIAYTILQADTNSVYSTIVAVNDGAKFGTVQGPYEYLTIFVAIIACIVTIGSFWIAYLTLNSQRKTEENTERMPFENMKDMLRHIFDIAYMNFIRSCAVFKKMEDSDLKAYPYVNQIKYMKLPIQYILLKECKKLTSESYVQLVKLSWACMKYNEGLTFYFDCFKDTGISRELKQSELVRFRYESAWMMCNIKSTIETISEKCGSASDCASMDKSDSGFAFTAIDRVHRNFGDDAVVLENQDIQLPQNILDFCWSLVGESDRDSLHEIINSDINVFLGKNKRGEMFIPMMTLEN